MILIAGAGVMVAFMAMHPTTHAHDVSGFVVEMGSISTRNAIVHGTLIAVFGIILLGLWGLAERIGMGSMLVRAGMLGHGTGWLALAGAAMVNGFIMPATVAHRGGDDPATIDRLKPLLALCMETNQALARAGVVAIAAAVVLWSIAMLRRADGYRAVGGVGLACGVLPLVAMAAGHLPMSVHGFGAFVLLLAVWYVAAGVQLVRGR
jgi:hypothetical protein